MNTELHQYTEAKRKELRVLSKNWDDLAKEVPQKFMQLLKSGMKPKVERGNSGSSRQLSVSLSFEMNTDAAKAYLEKAREEIQTVMEDFRDSMSDINDKLKHYYENKADPKEISSLIKVFVAYYDYVCAAKIEISKQTISFDISDETKETVAKWKKVDHELTRLAEAKRYGIDVALLDTHKKYLDAKRKKDTAKTSAAMNQLVRIFTELNDYLDSKELREYCEKEAAILKEKEDEAERLRREEEERKRREEEERKAAELRARQEAIYVDCLDIMSRLSTSEECSELIKKFNQIKGYKDVDSKIAECKTLKTQYKQKEEEAERLRLEEEERARKQGLYDEALFAMEQDTKASYKDAVVLLSEIVDFKDAVALKEQCENKIATLQQLEEEAKAKAEQEEKERKEKEEAKRQAKIAKKKKNMRLVSIVSLVIILLTIAIPYYNNVMVPKSKYNNALELIEKHEYDEAQQIFVELGSYENSQDMITETKYLKAKHLFDNKQYKDAATIFEELSYYKDSSSMKSQSLIELGKEYIAKEQYQEAIDTLSSIKYSSEAKPLYNQSVYNLGLQQFKKGEYKEGYDTLMSIRTYEDAKAQAQELYYQQGIKFYDNKEFDLSNEIFKTLGSYKDSKMLIHNHVYTEEVISELTCTQAGEINRSCECGKVENVKTEAPGHQFTTLTCTQDSTCTECGEVNETAVGHEIVEGVCTKCKEICIDPIVFEGSHGSLEEDVYTITVPKGTYRFSITTDLNTTTQRWTIKVDDSELYFGSSASKKSGTFNHDKTIIKDNTEVKVSVRVNGSYTLTITPVN